MDEGYLGIQDFTVQKIASIITGFACWLIGIVLAVMVIFLIIAGIRYFLARGNQAAVSAATENLKWTLIGILVILATNVIIATVANALGGSYSFLPLNCSFVGAPPPGPPGPPQPPQPPPTEAGDPPIISSFIPNSVTAGVKKNFNYETGIVEYTWLSLPFEIKGENLSKAVITSNNVGLDGKTGIEFKDLKASSTSINGYMLVHSTAKDGFTTITLNTPKGSATINLTVNITGTQYLQRKFKNQNVKFFGDWPKIMPDEEVLQLESLVNRGLQEINKPNYNKLGIVSHIYEKNYWDEIKLRFCNTPRAVGCANNKDNIIHVKGRIEGGVVYGPPTIIVHESAHKLHFFNLGMYKPIPSSTVNFDREWKGLLGNLISCTDIPVREVGGTITWSDGDTAGANTPRCGFVNAYGAYGVLKFPVFLSEIFEDVATFEEATHFYKDFLSDKSDSRYGQKIDLLRKYGF